MSRLICWWRGHEYIFATGYRLGDDETLRVVFCTRCRIYDSQHLSADLNISTPEFKSDQGIEARPADQPNRSKTDEAM